MRTVRIWFQKIGTARFISHLDLTRCMSRAIHRAKIPLWYTQGFNPRAFLTFALPLSLGVAGERESVDIKLEDDGPSNEELVVRLNEALPNDLPVLAVTEPVMKPGKIAYASFVMLIDPEGRDADTLAKEVTGLFRRESLVVPKHTKSGFVDFDIRPYIPFQMKEDANFSVGDYIYVPHVRSILNGNTDDIAAYVVSGGDVSKISLYITALTAEERQIIQAGCLINFNRSR